jgi:hypothetical protein
LIRYVGKSTDLGSDFARRRKFSEDILDNRKASAEFVTERKQFPGNRIRSGVVLLRYICESVKNVRESPNLCVNGSERRAGLVALRCVELRIVLEICPEPFKNVYLSLDGALQRTPVTTGDVAACFSQVSPQRKRRVESGGRE